MNDDPRTVTDARKALPRDLPFTVTMTSDQWRQLVDALGPASDDILDDIFGEVDWDDG